MMDKSGANKAALDAINAGRGVPIMMRQVKYLNNIVEQDQPAINRMSSPMLTAIELMHIFRMGQFTIDGVVARLFADQFMRWQDKSISRSTMRQNRLSLAAAYQVNV